MAVPGPRRQRRTAEAGPSKLTESMSKVREVPAGSAGDGEMELRVRRMHRRDINRVWEFLKLVFRDVNRETVEFQRPRHKKHFMETYEDEGVEQLVFEIKRGGKLVLVGYSEYAYEIAGSDRWINHRYFENRGMRPLFVDEIAVHPDYHGMGIGSFMFEQIDHAARAQGLHARRARGGGEQRGGAALLSQTQLPEAGRSHIPLAQARHGR